MSKLFQLFLILNLFLAFFFIQDGFCRDKKTRGLRKGTIKGLVNVAPAPAGRNARRALSKGRGRRHLRETAS